MKTVGTLILLLLGLSAHAYTFQHIKLTPAYEQYLGQAQMKTATLQSKSILPVNDPFKEAIRNAVFKRKSLNLPATKAMFNPFPPVDGEESLLYEQIRLELEATHREIGLTEVTQLNQINNQFNLGSSTFSGFSWQKPIGSVQIYANRQVTPNIYSENENDQWLVTDFFTIEFEATTILEKLKEAGVVDRTTDISAFAGISFKRVYRYDQYAKNYNDGLLVDFSKLFLPFLVFNAQGINHMGHKEIIKRIDNWTAKAGGLISTPPFYNLSFSAGVLAELSYEAETSMQSFKGQDPAAQAILMNIWSKTSKMVGVTASVQLDFFKILQLTLLRYDLNYEFEKGKNYVLSLNQNDLNHVRNTPEEFSEWKGLLRGNREVKHFEPYVVRLDETSAEAINQYGSIFLWGKVSKSKTEQKRIIKDEKVYTFYKNYSSNVRYVQNFFSRLWTAVIYKIFKIPTGSRNVAAYSKNVVLEYEESHPQTTNAELVRVANEEKFSFSIIQSYEAYGISKFYEKKYRADLIWFIDEFTTLPTELITQIKSGNIRGPVRAYSDLKVEKTGFLTFVNLPEDSIFKSIVSVCKSKRESDWANPSIRKRMLTKSQTTSADKCVRRIGLHYVAFKDDYVKNFKAPSIRKFKDFLTQYYKACENIGSLNDLFGKENTFISGSFSGKFPDGEIRSVSFANGQFRGNGVIDNFLRANDGQSTASITSKDL